VIGGVDIDTPVASRISSGAEKGRDSTTITPLVQCPEIPAPSN